MWFLLGNSPFVFTRLAQKNQILVYFFVYTNPTTLYEGFVCLHFEYRNLA